VNSSGARAAPILSAAFACLLAVACSGRNAGRPTATVPAAASPGRTTATAPAATSATPTSGGPTESGYELAQTLPEANFDRMLGLAAIPGSPNEAVVLTQGGVIYRVTLDGSSSPTLFGDVSGLLIKNPGNEEGLLGLAFSPKFEADGRAFVYYTAGSPRRSVLSRFQVSNGAMDMSSERVILEVPQPFANHNGGQLAFGPMATCTGASATAVRGATRRRTARSSPRCSPLSYGSTFPAMATQCRQTIRS